MKFTDSTGKEWEVKVNPPVIKRVRKLADFDLLAQPNGTNGVVHQLMCDPILLADVLYCVCKPQADEAGVTDEQFGGALGGDAISAGMNALFDALIEFIPNATQRPVARKAIQELQTMENEALAVCDEAIADPNFKDAMRTHIRATFGSLFGIKKSN